MWARILGALGTLSSKWSQTSFTKMKEFFTANAGLATTMQTATGTKSASGMYNWIRENKITSLFMLSSIVQVTPGFNFGTLVSDWFADDPEAEEVLQLVKDLYHTPDPQLDVSDKKDVKLSMLSDEFDMISRLRRSTGWTIQEIALIQAVMRFPASTFEQYTTLLDTAKRLT